MFCSTMTITDLIYHLTITIDTEGHIVKEVFKPTISSNVAYHFVF